METVEHDPNHTATPRGFTLMEVMLVLVILVILAGMAVPAYQSLQRSAYMHAARAQIGAFESALEAYHMNMSDYPPTLEGLWQPPMDAGGGGSWEGPYLRRQVTADPVGSALPVRVSQPRGDAADVFLRSGRDREQR